MPASPSVQEPPAVRVLTVAAVVLIAVGFFSPMWWVSLKGPQFPPDRFPKGVRILFRYNGVYNGCPIPKTTEVTEEEPVDCVQEMNTINHYIGMEPIERGARVEFAAAPYLFVVFELLLVAFLFYRGPGWWFLPIPAILLPVAFVLDYVYWLWWFGHHLHPWAAFTVKPFMPTALGEGRVAQFSTYSYPHYGMALMIAASLCLVLAVLLRRKALREAAPS